MRYREISKHVSMHTDMLQPLLFQQHLVTCAVMCCNPQPLQQHLVTCAVMCCNPQPLHLASIPVHVTQPLQQCLVHVTQLLQQ